MGLIHDSDLAVHRSCRKYVSAQISSDNDFLLSKKGIVISSISHIKNSCHSNQVLFFTKAKTLALNGLEHIIRLSRKCI